MSQKVKAGDQIKVHYTGKFEDGNIFDSSVGGSPLEFKVGEGQVIEGFDDAVVDMEVGEKKNFTVPPEKGYGEHNENLIVEMPNEYIPEDITPEVGMQLQIVDQDNNPVPVTVTEVLEDGIKLDANFPLAGKDLVFEIELVEIA